MGIVGLGAACELAARWLEDSRTLQVPDDTRPLTRLGSPPDGPGMLQLRDFFWERLQDAFGERVVLNGHPSHRLPNTLSVSFPGKVGGEILAAMPDVAASTGSACHSGSVRLSSVLQAMAVPTGVGMGALRFSLGRSTTPAEIDQLTSHLQQALARD
jgi:cysteine desulfurase